MCLDKSIISKYGDSAFITGDKLVEQPHEIIHVSPQIDLVLGGGIPTGSVVTIAGDMKVGKTTLALHILGKAQKIGKPTYYINVEGRLKKRDLEGINSLDQSKLNIIKSYKNSDGTCKIFSAEEFLDITEQIVHSVPNAVIVIDSISQLVTSSELQKDLGELSRAPGAVLMSQFCKRLSNVIPVNDIVIIGILHVIANTTGYGKTKVVSGGRKIQYAADVGLECKGIEYITDSKNKVIGQNVNWITTSTGLESPPGQIAKSVIIYGNGIDEDREYIDTAIELGIIKKNGKWFSVPNIEKQYNGKRRLYHALVRLPEFDDIKKMIDDIIYGNESD